MARRIARCLALAGLLAAGAACSGDASADFASAPARPSSAPESPAPAVAREEREWMYIHGPLNVRAAPRRDAPLVRTLARGDRVELGPADANGWARLHDPEAGEGFVYRVSSLVRAEPPAAAPHDVTPGYHLGPRGGCYTYTRSGNKRYVDRSYCQ